MIQGTASLDKAQVLDEERPESRAMGPAAEASRVPLLLGEVISHNIVSYEGWIYGIPQELGPIDLTEVDPMELPGVIRDVSRDVVENEILERVASNQQIAAE